MDSPRSVVSPLKNSSIITDSEKQNTILFIKNSDFPPNEINFQRKGTTLGKSEDFLGAATLEVYVHQARDIHNICIYQKQDVYAKLCLTSDPEITVSTKIINGGGRNPVFNENLRLNVGSVDCSLKCEIWMLSRVRNYLEDQLLGFALVPLSEILLNNGKLEKEFSLSSTDLFHSPAGFVRLSVSYFGAPPEVFSIPATTPTCVEIDSSVQDTESNFDNVEFPDPKVVMENHQMVEEYFTMPCESSDISEVGVQNVLSYSTSNEISSSKSCETPKDSKSPNREHVSPPNHHNSEEKSVNGLDNAVEGLSRSSYVKPVVNVNVEPEPKMVQQDIVDIYMTSMQQFTDSLAKMKLPVDFESGQNSSSNSSSDQKSPPSKNSSSRVFYGSRAFF